MRSKPKTFAKRETVDDKAVNPDVTITEKQVGIWKVKTAHTTFLGAEELKDDLRTAPALFWRLAKDIFNVSPRLVILWLLYQAWVSVSGSISLILSNNLLKSIEKALSAETHDESAMLKALCQRVFFSILTSCIPWYGYQLSEKLEKMVSLHFELILMKADFGVDLATSKGYDSKPETSASQVWNTLDQLTNFVRIMLSLFSDVAVIVSISSSQTALSYVILSLAHPAAAHFFRTRLTKVYLAFSNHDDFHHLQNLRNFTDGGFRPDIISGGLGAWILAQYEAVQERLQGVYTGDLESYMESKRIFPTSSAIFSVIGDLPLIYCALNAYYSPQTLSIVSLAILQQSSERLRFSINRLINSSRRFRMNVDKLRALYKPDLPSSILTGDKKYRSDEKASAGMSFELRNLTFSYPGAQDRKALDNVSLRIKRGDLVVVVGANGSGKSTLIRILSRLYEPTSGELLIDDLLASEYSVDDLHRSTTLLSQDNLMYPLALRLNIGLGYPGKEHDQEMVDDAARQGGAAEFIAKLGDGMDTRLDPGIICHPVGLRGKKDHPLYQEMQRLVKKTEISGGEKQRIAASRAFMRFKTGHVNFVAVDEPSSALDADGELKLFENLIAVRQGKTMVFVTHRFGHLTKYADQIICMKDGSIAEHGSHEELMEMNGEYANLYKIQAGAFAG